MSVTFYDGPDGRLFMQAPTGSGEFVGAATDRDIMLNPKAYAVYQEAKAKAVSEVEEALKVADVIVEAPVGALADPVLGEEVPEA